MTINADPDYFTGHLQLEVKPITLVYGPNNVGKSMLLQLRTRTDQARVVQLPRPPLDVEPDLFIRASRWCRDNFGCCPSLADPHGSGLSQVLPVIATIMDADSGTYFIEAPEAGLDSKLQRRLAELILSTATWCNRPSFVLETHSQIMLLRIQVAVARGEISPDDVVIYSVEHEPHSGRCYFSYISKVTIDAYGRLSGSWSDPFAEVRNLARELVSLRQGPQ